MASKNKSLPYILFGIPIAIGVYFIVKSIKEKSKGSSIDEKPKDLVKEVVDNFKKVVLPIIKKDNFPLKKGSYGENVKKLQTALMQYNPSLPKGWNDSDFGSKTEAELLKVTKQKVVDNQKQLDSIISGGQSKADSSAKAIEEKRTNQLFNLF